MERVTGNRISFRSKSASKNKVKEMKTSSFDLEKMSYLSQENAKIMDDELYKEYAFTEEQLVELSGYSSAVAIAKSYPVHKHTKRSSAVLVCCGPGKNGAIGLVCARHLKFFGYKPTIYYPKRPIKLLYETLMLQCERIDMPFLSFFPGEAQLISSSYYIVIDAIFGINYTGPCKPEWITVLDTLSHIEIPLCSIDIPSGWEIDGRPESGILPEFLISLGAPKLCSRHFLGRYHYLGGRFLPQTLEEKFSLVLPTYRGTDCVTDIKVDESND